MKLEMEIDYCDRDLKNKASYTQGLIYNTLSLNSYQERANHHFLKAEITISSLLEKVIDWGPTLASRNFVCPEVCVCMCIQI